MTNLLDDEIRYRRAIQNNLDEIDTQPEQTFTVESVSQSPLTAPVSGVIGQVIEYSGSLYRKVLSNGIDTNWAKVV
jgi:hypothetical protein